MTDEPMTKTVVWIMTTDRSDEDVGGAALRLSWRFSSHSTE